VGKSSPRRAFDADAFDDAVLVEAAQRGDRRAFGDLVRRHRPRVFALALRVTRNAADADDVSQDTFVRAFRRLHRFQGRCRFSTWLHRIALNRALSRATNLHRHGGTPFEESKAWSATPLPAHDPHRAYELGERRAALARALAQLSPSLRTTVLMIACEGVNQRDAAARLGCRAGTVGWRLHQARAELRKMLAAAEAAGAQPRSDIAT
jgi:RNA polymerase sigma-70 factor (ECF subfamily)